MAAFPSGGESFAVYRVCDGVEADGTVFGSKTAMAVFSGGKMFPYLLFEERSSLDGNPYFVKPYEFLEGWTPPHATACSGTERGLMSFFSFRSGDDENALAEVDLELSCLGV